MCHPHVFSLLLLTALTCVCCFKSSCLNAESSSSDNITVLQCVEDAVAIEWNAENDLQYIAFEYSCIHPTNSALSVLNQSFPFWNDGQNGRTTITPLAGALCLFSACYLDQDNTRHFISPTSCITTPSAANGVETIASSKVMLTDTSYITETPQTKELSMATSLRDGRAVSQQPRNVYTPFVAAAAAALIVATLVASVTTAIFIVRVKNHSCGTTPNQYFTSSIASEANKVSLFELKSLRCSDEQCRPDKHKMGPHTHSLFNV